MLMNDEMKDMAKRIRSVLDQQSYDNAIEGGYLGDQDRKYPWREDYLKDINVWSHSQRGCILVCDMALIQSVRERQEIHDYVTTIHKVFIKHDNKADELQDVFETYWNTRQWKDYSEENRSNISKLKEFINRYGANSLIVNSMLRMSEFYYNSHQELQKMNLEIEEHLDDIPMLCKGGVFKEDNKNITLRNLQELNLDHLVEYCNDSGIPVSRRELRTIIKEKSFREYMSNNKFVSPKVSMYMSVLKSSFAAVVDQVEEGKILVHNTKNSATGFSREYSSSQLEDNFITYPSSIVSRRIVDLLNPYQTLSVAENYDYVVLSYGLGPYFKYRVICYTNGFLQKLGDVVKRAGDLTYGYYQDQGITNDCPIRTKDQSGLFLHLVNEGKIFDYKYCLCYDVSKYSDNLVVQSFDEILDWICKGTKGDWCESLKKLYRLPVKVGTKLVELPFGTGQGVKGDFDLITVANMLIIDYAAYLANVRYDYSMVVGDDMFVLSDYEQFNKMILISYFLFNCPMNEHKRRLVENEGHITFCGNHFWINKEKRISTGINGLSPNLWMSDICSFSRFSAIMTKMKANNTWEVKHSEIFDKIVDEHWEAIERENKLFKAGHNRSCRILYSGSPEKNNYERLKQIAFSVPYYMGGLNEDPEYVTHEEFKKFMYNSLHFGIISLSSEKANKSVHDILYNSTVSKIFNDFFDHPLICEMYADPTKNLQACYNAKEFLSESDLTYDVDREELKRLLTKASASVMKVIQNQRVSTKDRTSDYYYEDRFLFNSIDFESNGYSESTSQASFKNQSVNSLQDLLYLQRHEFDKMRVSRSEGQILDKSLCKQMLATFNVVEGLNEQLFDYEMYHQNYPGKPMSQSGLVKLQTIMHSFERGNFDMKNDMTVNEFVEIACNTYEISSGVTGQHLKEEILGCLDFCLHKNLEYQLNAQELMALALRELLEKEGITLF